MLQRLDLERTLLWQPVEYDFLSALARALDLVGLSALTRESGNNKRIWNMRDKLIRQKSARAGASDPGHFSFSHAAIFNTEYNREASKVDCFVTYP